MPIADTIRGFKEIVEGKHDEMPEQAFYMVGTIEEVVEKAQGDEGAPEHMALPTQAARSRSSRPIASLVNEEVDEVAIPGAEGYFGVLPGHTPLLAMLKVGELWYRQGQEKHLPRDRVRVRRGAARPRDHPGAGRRAGGGDRHRARRSARRSAPRSGSREPT